MNNEAYYNYNKKDGVLTALEAVNLNLDHTDFVVLSACETGLGKIKNGEGVYGLQRALQIAGAKTVIMSLFKVDDQVTQKLMELFYSKYLTTFDKKSSFLYAKKELMKKYNAPYYWGAFILVE
jgi:CHAT domain-containing protein